jgi:hypothetical protein
MRPRRKKNRPFRKLLVSVGLLLLTALAFLGGVREWLSGATLATDSAALARIDLQSFAGSVVSVQATGSNARRIPLTVHGRRLTPRRPLIPGAKVSITVVVRRPGWSSWALGSTRRETLLVRAPVARLAGRWLTVPAGSPPRVRFDSPVSLVSVGGHLVRVTGTSAPLPRLTAGTVKVAATARPWERLPQPVAVTWFPQADKPVVLAQPATTFSVSPLTPLRLTFSRPVADFVGSSDPIVAPAVRGHWLHPDSHTLLFRPAGFGAPFDHSLSVRLNHQVAIAMPGNSPPRLGSVLTWSVAPASFLRLQQLLAQEGYLPVTWTPTQPSPVRTARSELAAAISAPPGIFRWRYANTPDELRHLWKAGEPNAISRGAVMMFEDDHGLTVDGIAGAQVWHAVLADALAGRHRTDGYSYVFVHRNVPQLLTLWHDGRVLLTSPGNTGVPAAPTALGTWPVFEHIPVGRMSGTNPDGSHYNDPGIRWISYFHGGEALHAFNRASFGTPQSLGCVELPLATAARVWPYTPIGTLVTIED